MSHKKQQSTAQQQEPKNTGGREFGQVIEPTQAQMASVNQGLADDLTQQPVKKPARRTRKAA